MQPIDIQFTLQHFKNKVFTQFTAIHKIVASLDASGGRALLVGGAVRDLFLQKEIKDLDIEVHGIPLQQLEAILSRFGHVRLVGKLFGVLRIDGLDVDWSLPRMDGAGRKPKVTIDPHLSLTDAFGRRDLTINAMGIDLITFQLEDPFNGLKDLQNKLLRAPDCSLFVKDPLRFYRVMQFVGRFEFYLDPQLQELCRTMDITAVAQERVYQEYEKLFLRSVRPSKGIRWLHDIGRLKTLLPELYNLIGVEQEYVWHPEGDVFEHTMQAIDKAATLECSSQEERLILVFAALCHDLGKVSTTKVIEGRIRAFGHDTAGVPLTESLLSAMTNVQSIKKVVKKLVRYHMMPGAFIKSNAKRAAYKRLAKKLSPETNCAFLAQVALADMAARNPEKDGPLIKMEFENLELFKEQAEKVGVLYGPEDPILMGKDLLEYMPPGPAMGKMLARAYDIQINEGITNKHLLLSKLLK